MNLVACDGTWSQSPTGEILCDGALQIVVGGGPFGLPPITYADANLLLLSIAGLWATVWAFRQAARLF
jgi:hypothetical protein